MGDRANCVIEDRDNPRIYFYTHWAGEELPEIVRAALDSPAGRSRWRDSQYLARIIFCRMVGAAYSEETGYGISTEIGDNTVGRPLLVVNISKQTVRFEGEDDKATVESYSFAEYCAQPRAWPKRVRA